MLSDSFSVQEKFLNFKKIENFSAALCKNYLPKKGNKKGKITTRFLSGITPKGVMFLSGTIDKISDKQIIIKDKYGAASNQILKRILNHAVLSGYSVLEVPSALFPLTRTEHVVIPELRLAFCSENDYVHLKSDARRIHSRRFEENGFSDHRNRLNFNKKAAKELLEIAAATLLNAKASHDALEKFYVDAMNFEEYNKNAAKIVGKLFL